MITVDENTIALDSQNNISSEDDIQNKINMLKDSVSIGEVPEDLKNFLLSLQQSETDEVSDEELLADEVEDEYLDMGESQDVEYSNKVDVDSVNANDTSVDDLEDIF